MLLGIFPAGEAARICSGSAGWTSGSGEVCLDSHQPAPEPGRITSRWQGK